MFCIKLYFLASQQITFVIVEGPNIFAISLIDIITEATYIFLKFYPQDSVSTIITVISTIVFLKPLE